MITRQEAIEILTSEKTTAENDLKDVDMPMRIKHQMRREIEAYDMAIQALSDPITISEEITIREAIHILEHSRIVSDDFTPEGLTAAYVAALTALYAEESKGTHWISVEDRLPEPNKGQLLFVVHTPAWVDKTGELSPEDSVFEEQTEVVAGWLSRSGETRYWTWDTEFMNHTIKNEVSIDQTGEIRYVTHWMLLPNPPEKEAQDNEMPEV